MLFEDLIGVGVAREDDQGDLLERAVLLDLLADQKAIHRRQLDRKQDQRGRIGLRTVETRGSLLDDFELHVATGEPGAQCAGEL